MYTRTTFLAGVASLLLIGTAGAETPPKAPAIERFITDDALGMVRINVSTFDINPWIDLTKKAAANQLDDMARRDLESFRAMAAGLQIVAKGAGIRDLYLVFDTHELYQQNLVYAVAFVAERAKPEMLKQVVQRFGGKGRVKFAMRKIDGAFVFGTAKTLTRIEQGPTIGRPEMAKAMTVAGDSPLQVYYLPSQLHRRVLAELSLPLPEQLGGAGASKIGAAVQWAAFVADTAPDATLRLVVQAGSDAEARQIGDLLERAAQMGLTRLAASGGVGQDGKKAIARLKKFIPQLVPQRQGSRLIASVDLVKNGALLAETFAPAVVAQRASAHRIQSRNKLRMLGLGMHNYHDRHDALPTVANFDDEGRPLLSWRVHILPYIEQKQLYTEFHLDEPWDSEHNRQLIRRMPKVFRSPSARTPITSGLTPYVVPVGEGTMFTGKADGIELEKVIDGTSNTIMILQVADSEAVTWTKPEDWSFDAKHPKHDMAIQGSDLFQFAFGDVSIRTLKTDISAEELIGLLLRNDGRDALQNSKSPK